MKSTTAALAITLTALTSTGLAGIELTTNGDFELGDTSGWSYFPTPASTFDVTPDAFAGSWAGEINNTTEASAGIIKQANIGIGTVMANQEVNISFWAKGAAGVGGVSFAEFFSEVDGGGVSSGEILGGAPLFVGADWQEYNFTTMTGADVSAGVTLQFAAVTGAVTGSTMQLLIDNVSVSVVPAPGSVALLGLGGLVATRRRR